jgi:hypothetical protein
MGMRQSRSSSAKFALTLRASQGAQNGCFCRKANIRSEIEVAFGSKPGDSGNRDREHSQHSGGHAISHVRAISLARYIDHRRINGLAVMFG